ncbi:MAG: RES family NAD+ phosphorylase [Ilumatobacteraceae bacterium]
MKADWPALRAIRWDDTHRLIPDAYASTDRRLLAPLAASDDDLEALVALRAATSRRTLVQQGRIPSGIHSDELVYGTPEWQIVNASFCYPHPSGARFNGPDRGAWYAGREVETSLAEVSFHKSVELAETGWWTLSVVYQDFLADIHGPFHDLGRPRDARARACLDPASYERSQALAQQLLDDGSLGIVYPAVRHRGGEAVACFRPATVGHVRRGGRYRITWDGGSTPTIGTV